MFKAAAQLYMFAIYVARHSNVHAGGLQLHFTDSYSYALPEVVS